MADLAKQTIPDEHKEMLVNMVKNGPRNSIADVVRDILADKFEAINEDARIQSVLKSSGWKMKHGGWHHPKHNWKGLNEAFEIAMEELK